jgi:hypothetical protein
MTDNAERYRREQELLFQEMEARDLMRKAKEAKTRAAIDEAIPRLAAIMRRAGKTVTEEWVRNTFFSDRSED